MKKIGFIAFILSLASSLFLFSIGFATWTSFALPAMQGTNGSITSYGVVDYVKTDYISGATTMFRYKSPGFVDSLGKSTDTGTITTDYSIDIDACREVMGNDWNGTLTVEILAEFVHLISYDDEASPMLFSTLADGKNVRSVSVAVKKNGVTLEGATVENRGSSLAISQQLTGLPNEGECVITVEYTFAVPEKYADGTAGNFYQNFGKHLSVKDGEKTEFVTTATIAELK